MSAGQEAADGQRSRILKLAIRFADLWAVDPHQMAEETYAPAIHMESMAGPTVVDGLAMLHDLEDRLAALIPFHRHELVRVLVDPPAAFLETTVVGPATGEYAQAALWWLVAEADGTEGAGKVTDEVGWFQWADRRADSAVSRGFVPADDGRPRGSADWYRELVRGAAAAFGADPIAAARQYLADSVVVTHVGHSETRGLSAVLDALGREPAGPAAWPLEILRVIGDGAVVAALFVIGTGPAKTRGTLVATLDDADSACSVRLYLDWHCAASPADREGRQS